MPRLARKARDRDRETRVAISRRQLLTGGAATVAATGLGACRDDRSPGVAPSREPGPEPDQFCAIGFFNPHEAATVDALVARILPGTPDDPGAREAGVLNYIDCLLAAGGYAEPVYTQGPFPAPDADPDTDAIELPAGVTEDDRRPFILRGEPAGGADALPIEPTGFHLEQLRDDSIESSSYGVLPIPKGRFDRYGWQSVLSPPELYRRGLRSLDVHTAGGYGARFVDLDDAQQDEVIGALEADEATGFDLPSAQGFFELVRRHVVEGMFCDPIHGGNRGMVGWELIGYPGAYRAWTPDELRREGTRRPPQSIATLHRSSPGHSHRDEPTLPVSGSRQRRGR